MPKKKLILIFILSMCLVIGSTQVAQAYNLSGKKWSNPKTVTYSYITGTPTIYINAINNAANAWNNNCNKVYTAFNTSSAVKYTTSSDTSTKIDGSTSLNIYPFTNTIYGASVWLNSYWGNQYDDDGRQGLVAHEMGHVWGLLDTGYYWAVMLSPSEDRQYYNNCIPRLDDIDGINAIYP